MRVGEAFDALRPFELLVLHACLVRPETFDGPDLFVAREEASRHWVVRHDKDDCDADSNSDKTADQEHDLPACEAFTFVVLETKGYQRADDRSAASA